jgi:hypothetical protein
MVVVFPPFPPGGPSPVSENSSPSQSTPLNFAQDPPERREFPDTVNWGGDAKREEFKKPKDKKAQNTTNGGARKTL